MRKSAAILFLMLLYPGAAAAELLLELRVDYFRPSGELFRTVYGGGMVLAGEVSTPVWKSLDVYLAAGYFSKNGELTLSGDETRLRVIPLEGGVKYRLLGGRLYAGIGMRYHQYKETTPIENVSSGDIGFVIKIGSYVELHSGWTIDFHIDPSHCRTEPADLEADLGGLSAGIGLGFRF